MTFSLEFHDSEVRDVVADGTDVRIRFAAATGRDDDGARGWLTTTGLTLAAATLSGDVAHAFGKITEGRLRHDGADIARLPLPATLAGDIELALRFANGTTLSVRAAALALNAARDAVFTPDFSC